MTLLDLELLNRSFQNDQPYIEPRFAMFNVVKRCNAGCQYCADWKNDPDPRTDPSASHIRSIIDGLRELGVLVVMFTGGEPLLRKDIFELMEYTLEREMHVSMITNGTALTEQAARRLLEMPTWMLGISIDSLNEARMQTIRGLKLARVLKAITMVAALKRAEYPEQYVMMNVTISRLNIADLLPLAELAAQLDIEVSYQPVQAAGSGATQHVDENLWPNAAEIAQIDSMVDQLINLKEQGYPISNRAEFLAQIPHFFQQRSFYPGDQCTVAYTDVVIDTEFGVRPCWPMEPVTYLNDQTTRIQDVWFSPEMKAARATIRAKKCPGCLYACHLNKPHTPLPPLPAKGLAR